MNNIAYGKSVGQIPVLEKKKHTKGCSPFRKDFELILAGYLEGISNYWKPSRAGRRSASLSLSREGFVDDIS